MTEFEPYTSPRAVESAIKEAAKTAAVADPSLDVSKRIQLEYFNRFLSRVFSEREESEWVLKGGTGILARVPSTRSTRDIDLYHDGFTLLATRDDLIRLAAIDLEDHFHFAFADATETVGHDAQPYATGLRMKFRIFIGNNPKGELAVDVVAGPRSIGDVITTDPATSLKLPKLVNNPYRLYPVVDQIADKVCATMALYNGKPSSRVKDLVDLVVLGTTQDIDGALLKTALATTAAIRELPTLNKFAVPSGWGTSYSKIAKSVTYCDGYRSVELAKDLVARLIDPALSGEAVGKTWSHQQLTWLSTQG